jgi:hypothetical protein
VLAEFPRQPRIWMSYGHALKNGRAQLGQHCGLSPCHCPRAHAGRGLLEPRQPQDLHLFQTDVAAMRSALARGRLARRGRLHFEFSLGKALEDERAYAESFAHYASGNSLAAPPAPLQRRRQFGLRAALQGPVHGRSSSLRARRRCAGARSLFIVGMPRAGSTLLEQILASHSQVEGTMELPNIPQIARELAGEDSRFLESRGGSRAR